MKILNTAVCIIYNASCTHVHVHDRCCRRHDVARLRTYALRNRCWADRFACSVVFKRSTFSCRPVTSSVAWLVTSSSWNNTQSGYVIGRFKLRDTYAVWLANTRSIGARDLVFVHTCFMLLLSAQQHVMIRGGRQHILTSQRCICVLRTTLLADPH